MSNVFCPGCGITRMIFSLINLEFVQAFRYNPLVFILLFSYIIFLIIKLFFKFKLSNKQKNIIAYTLLSIVIIFGILRNLPLFEYLKPTIIK